MGHQTFHLSFDSFQLFLLGKKYNQHYLVRIVFAQRFWANQKSIKRKELLDVCALGLEFSSTIYLTTLWFKNTTYIFFFLLLQEASTDSGI